MSEDYLPSQLNKVTKIEPLGGFRVAVRFRDGATGDHDFAALVTEPGPMLDPLRDPTYFARVALEDGAPTWPNGYDMCPDWLRMTMEKAGELKLRTAAE